MYPPDCRPLELLLGASSYGPEIDMWSAGCVAAELYTGKPIVPGNNELDQVQRICSVSGWPTESTMPGCSSLPRYINDTFLLTDIPPAANPSEERSSGAVKCHST